MHRVSLNVDGYKYINTDGGILYIHTYTDGDIITTVARAGDLSSGRRIVLSRPRSPSASASRAPSMNQSGASGARTSNARTHKSAHTEKTRDVASQIHNLLCHACR